MDNKILNKDRTPPEPGYYSAIDSTGHQDFQYFDGNVWLSSTGHPIEYWIENKRATPLVFVHDTEKHLTSTISVVSKTRFIEALKEHWRKHFKVLGDNNDRDGYFMVGFCSDVFDEYFKQ